MHLAPRRWPAALTCVACILLSSHPALAQSGGRVLVKLAARAHDDDEARKALAPLGIAFVKRTLMGWVVGASVDGDARTAVDRARNAKGVLAAEPVTKHTPLRIPSDQNYSYLWGFQDINVEQAWDTAIGDPSQRIGLVDSGITRDHYDLSPRDAGGWDFISDAFAGVDGDGRDAEYNDDDRNGEFHGSHVAGIMAASADDDYGVPGVNWAAGLMTVRALNADGGDIVDIAEGTAWLAGFHIDGVPDIGSDQVSVVNLSLGSNEPCGSYESDVYGAITASGVTVVAASGNDGSAYGTGSPASCPGVIAVAAYGPDLRLTAYSNFDARVDVVAPGGDANAGYGVDGQILSVDGATYDSDIFMEGTSMAAPHVSGVVSLMQAVNPFLSPAQIRAIFQNGSSTCYGCANVTSLDAGEAVDAALYTAGELGGTPGGNGTVLGDVPTDPGTGTAGDACPANSSETTPGSGACACNAGFIPNADLTGCDANTVSTNPDPGPAPTPQPNPSPPPPPPSTTVPPDPNGGLINGHCPAHSALASNGSACQCDDGYVVDDSGTGCTPSSIVSAPVTGTGPGGSTPPDNNTTTTTPANAQPNPGATIDGEDRSGQPVSETRAGCSAAGASGELSAAALPLIVLGRRRRRRAG